MAAAFSRPEAVLVDAPPVYWRQRRVGVGPLVALIRSANARARGRLFLRQTCEPQPVVHFFPGVDQ
jgi:hypothetical protein